MSELSHLRIENAPDSAPYIYAGPVPQGATFDLPPRNKPAHAKKLKQELETARADAQRRRAEASTAIPGRIEWKPEGIVLTFQSEVGHELSLEGLERRGGIHLLGVTEDAGTQTARVFVPEGKLKSFLNLVDAYAKSIVLTIFADARNSEKIKGLEDDEANFKFWGPIRKAENGQVKIRFVVPEASSQQFKDLVGDLATSFSTSRKNEKLIDSVTSVRLALTEDFWQDRIPFPRPNEEIWWEIWLRGNRKDADNIYARFIKISAAVGIDRVSKRFIAFPERVVLLAYASPRQLATSVDLLAMIAELRKAKELATPYVMISPREQNEFVDAVVSEIVPPGEDAPSVCILDTGVNRAHPLIEPALNPDDLQAVEIEWGTSDHDMHQHGTGIAGIALYGCLTEVMMKNGPITLSHRLESVKLLPPPPKFNEPEVYGRVTQDAVARAQIQAPRRNRAICMAVTADDRDMGMPTTWSGAVDDLCAGVLDGFPKLMLISAGNVRDELCSEKYTYHDWNVTHAGIEDPGQSWNALTIGAYTEKVTIEQKEYADWQPIATSGDLTPTSRTSLPWPNENQRGWPIKPDLVMEGGNYAERGRNRDSCDDLSLLTTILHPTGRLLETTRDTTPATAGAARLAAIIWSRYPRLWPETVRGLLVHSAGWTKAMRERFPGDQKNMIHKCLRCYGYGVPDERKALHSAENAATLIFEGQLQPFCKNGNTCKTNEMHLHELPWPTAVLEDLEEATIKMRVTLSYFVQPSPNNVGWGKNHRYASHGLRFDVIRPLESVAEFKKRVSKSEWDAPNKRPESVEETRGWVIGSKGRAHGSLHSDWWVGKAVDLSRCNRIAVFPVTGWWKERQHLEMYDRKTRYSLIVSIETEEKEVDLYTPIANIASIRTEIET